MLVPARRQRHSYFPRSAVDCCGHHEAITGAPHWSLIASSLRSSQ
jgi:hypothetical protein